MADGAHLSTACKLVKLNGQTFRRWRSYKDEPWLSFIAECDVAEAQGELFHIRKLKDAADGKSKGDWRASAEFLKRRHGDRWNRGWSPVEAEAPDEGLGDIKDVLADQTKTERAADLVEQYVNGTNSQPAGIGSVVPGWLRGDSKSAKVAAPTAPRAAQPGTPRGRRRKDSPPDSGDATPAR